MPFASLVRYTGSLPGFSETHIFFQSDKSVSCLFVKFTIFVRGFRPWCNSNGVMPLPVCVVNRITCSARFKLSVNPILSSKFANSKFFSDWIVRSTNPVAVCIYGRPVIVSILYCLQNCLNSELIKALSLSVRILLGTPCRLKWFSRNFITVLDSEFVQIFAVVHLLK